MTAKECTNLAFETAKLSTQFGYGVAKGVLGGLGLPILPLEVAEFFSLTGIEIGRGATNFSLKTSSEVVRVVQEFFGDPFGLELAKSVIALVSTEIKATGQKISMVEVWKYFSVWVSLQKLTRHRWREEFVFPHVTEIHVKSKDKSPKVWKLLKKPFMKNGKNGNVNLRKFNPSKDLANLMYFSKVANGCYGERALEFLKGQSPTRKNSSELHFYSNYTGIPITDVIYMSKLETKSDIFNSDYQPRFIFSVDHVRKTVILAFRGTLSARDVIVDLAGESVELSIGSESTLYSLHGGILKVVSRISHPEHSSGIHQRTLSLLNEFPDYSLTLTGHSLGAGVASILGILWADPDTCTMREAIGFPSRSVHVYAFACPSIMDERLAYRCWDMITTAIIGWDWLARVSHASVLEIRDAAIKLKTVDKENPQLIESILSGQISEDELNSVYELRRTITKELIPQENDYQKIHPPGMIIWIYQSQSKPDTFSFYEVHDRCQVFGEILFDDSMLDHHQPTSFDTIFDKM